MDDLISRSAILAEYDRQHIGAPGKARALMVAPAVDAVPVIRCKDCDKRETMECALSYFVIEDFDVDVRFLDVSDDFYCAYGERKTDADL